MSIPLKLCLVLDENGKTEVYFPRRPHDNFHLLIREFQKGGLPPWKYILLVEALVTAYRVVMLKRGAKIKNVNIPNTGTTSLSVGDLERDTEYNVNVFARIAVVETRSCPKDNHNKDER